METQISTVLAKLAKQLSLPEISTKTALENYKHIELTEDEMDVAVLEAKIRKESILQSIENQKRIEENRKRRGLTNRLKIRNYNNRK